jgi:hypothetical protein
MPETKKSAIFIIIILIIRRNNPNVTIVMGNVRIISNGLTMALRIASTNAKIIAVLKEFITICGSKNFDKTYTATAVISKLIMNFIIIKFEIKCRDSLFGDIII